MDDPSPYELLRLKRVEENRRILKELGLLEPDKPRVFVKRCVQKPVKPRSKSSNGIITSYKNEPDEPRRSVRARKSTRFSLKDDDPDYEYNSLSDSSSEDEIVTAPPPKRIKVHRPNSFGAIEGVEVGTIWKTRMDCSFDGVHKPTVAGIHGSKEGAYSIALSGGYEDDLDFGEGFTYTGSGGRDLKGTATKPKNLRTAPQSKDQTLDGVNGSLVASVVSKLPIRVIRGYKLPSEYAPEEGYRYDGLYTAEKFWFATGLSGFKVVKFALKRVEDQAPPPWDNGKPRNLEIQPQNTSMDLLKVETESQDANDEINQLEQTNVESSTQTEESCLTDIKLNKRKRTSSKKILNTLEENETDLSNAANEEDSETDSLENRSFEIPFDISVVAENLLSKKTSRKRTRDKMRKNSHETFDVFENLVGPYHENGVNMQYSKTPKIRIKSELDIECGCKSSSGVSSMSTEVDDEDFCKQKDRSVESSDSEQDNMSHDGSQKYKPFQDLPGQTKILNYFKPCNTKCSTPDKILKVDEFETKDTSQKKKSNKEIVVAKSLRGNQRPSLYADSFNFSSSIFSKCELPPKNSNKLESTKESLPKNNLQAKKNDSKNNNKSSLKILAMTTSRMISPSTVFKNQKKNSIKSPNKVQMVNSPVKVAYDKMQVTGLLTDEALTRSCYVKLFRITNSEFKPFPGWDYNYMENFMGFINNDIEIANIKKIEFNDFLKALNKNEEEIKRNEESRVFHGWDDGKHSRSIIVNAFLIDKYSKI